MGRMREYTEKTEGSLVHQISVWAVCVPCGKNPLEPLAKRCLNMHLNTCNTTHTCFFKVLFIRQ